MRRGKAKNVLKFHHREFVFSDSQLYHKFTYRVRDEVEFFITLIVHQLANFVRHEISLFVHQRAGKGKLLALEIEKVHVDAHIFGSVVVDFHDILL